MILFLLHYVPRKYSLSFRNYTPLNEELKADDSKITTHKDIGDTVEKKMEGVVEKVIEEEEQNRAKDVVRIKKNPSTPPLCDLLYYENKPVLNTHPFGTFSVGYRTFSLWRQRSPTGT